MLGVLLLPAAGGALTKKERTAAAESAVALMTEGRYEDAALSWEKALTDKASGKELSQGLPLLGICYERLGVYPKAITAYQRALRRDEKNINRLLDMARVYALVELDREAIELYKHILARDKHKHDARFALARLYVKTGRWDDARREAETYAAWEPRDLAIQRLLAEVDEAEGALASAGNRREQILAREPSPEGYFELGRLWFRAGRWDASGDAFSKAEQMGLRTGAVFLHKGVIRWLKHDSSGANKLWHKALERYPGMGAAHFFLAAAAKEGGKRSESEVQSRRAKAGAQSALLKQLADDLLENNR